VASSSEPMSDEAKRIRSYLQAQGAKLPPAALVDRVQAAMDDLRLALDAVPADRMAERPAPDDWSADEVMAHVLDSGAHFATSITRAIDGEAGLALRERTGSGAAPHHTAAEWSARLRAERQPLFDRVLRADPGAHLEPVIEHPFFGMLNWREAVLFLRIHDLDHARQIQAVAAALAARPA